ncbi:ATP-binding protein [Paracoccus denitrificans]|jgi:signal transduction histidine kinase|uniref:histidine kinase n=1 Tax=Paracoccus denitrificans (strain Pd 1222) TaxID=318586 RepID=A1B7L5_PARDP|nr:ATP-binding protein [Paracoccus denitrificans]ABL71509.1 histidine kinase [Paracoccus denitrificans PD1222]MBB4629770.1 signal transduction histidine kinase [Paracoccus denitrificans]MCU7431179.1 ATP-binding protein [Paracoccus denitrificans]QAR28110.1 HAMP domain-containing protein [Paracoccus denitrificans]UPV97837.1 ATP-binding protein [Paracoccus denitrificans]
MSSLQTRIAALLIAAIVSVVVLATYTATSVMRPPLPQATMEPVARQIHATLALLGHGQPQDRPGALQPAPAGGEPDERMSRFLGGALRHTGQPLEARVSKLPGQESFTASIRVGDGRWFITEIPDLSPPPGRWKVLVIWLALIVLGSAAISIHAARRLTRPLQLLEDAVDRVGPDGVLEQIPETGTGEVRTAARALNRLSAQLRQAMESRMRLVAAAGHDLRTPMTRMRLRAEFIEDDAERAKWLSDLEELDMIADSAIRLVREEVGLDGGEPIRLDRLLRQIALELHALDQKVELGALPPLTVHAGPIALKRALRNLIANAATHGGGARVALAREGDDAVIRIEDDGPGVPPELLAQIFEPFFRVDQARRKSFPGAGLGLAIAREIVERHLGRITIRNREPRGLLQICTLPCAQSGRS